MSLIALLTALNNYSIQPFLPLIASDLQTSIGVAGQAAGVTLLAGAFAGLAAGPIAGIVGFKRVAIAGLLLIASSAAGVSIAPNLELLLAARIVAGLGGGATLGISLAYVGMVHEQPARQRALSYVAAASSISAVLGIPLLTTVEGPAGWRGALLAIGAIAALLIAFLYRYLREPAYAERAPWRGIGPALRLYAPVVRDTRMVPVVFGLLAAGAGNIGTVTYFSAFYADRHGASTGQIGLLLALAGGSYTFGSVIGGLSLINVRSRGTYILLGLSAGLCTLALFSSYQVFDPALIVSMVTMVVALVASGVLTMMLMMTLSYEGQTRAAETMAINASVTSFGAALGVAVGGLLLDIGGFASLGMFGGLSFILVGVAAALRDYFGPVLDERVVPGYGGTAIEGLPYQVPSSRESERERALKSGAER